MKKLSLVLSLMLITACSQKEIRDDEDFRNPAATTVRLQDSQFFEYDVRFTNPVCREYKYDKPLTSYSGKTISARPKNVFCSQEDAKASNERPESPMTKLLSWIKDSETKEIFFTYLSFSNSTVSRAVCEAATQRNVKVTFILDTTSDLTKAQELAACGTPSNKPNFQLRGHAGGLGYAHNKLFIVNPNSKDKIRIAFSSGNMTSGIALHHENWHFITTHVNTFFAQSNLCMMHGMLDKTSSSSKKAYSEFMRSCRGAIQASEEEDIKVSFIPGDGERATSFMINGYKGYPGIAKSKSVWIAAHRFSYYRMVEALRNRVKMGGVDMRIVADDDTYWVGTTGQKLGDNGAEEFKAISGLTQMGAKSKYMETNDSQHLLHHNKYLIFDDKAVFAGAGNLTGTAFSENFENFYYIMIPSVVEKFRAQYEHVWKDMATAPDDMPRDHVIPDSASH